MMPFARIFRLGIPFLFLVLIVAGSATGESAKSRVDRFRDMWPRNPIEALRLLCPIDNAQLVDYVMDIWVAVGKYDYYFDSAMEDTLITTTVGPALDKLHKHMTGQDKAPMRAKLARVVGRMAHPESFNSLVGALKKEAEPDPQVALIEALAKYPGDKTIAAILPFLDKMYRPEVRITAVEAMGALKGSAASAKLADLAASDTMEIRCSAIWALGLIGGPDAERAVLTAISALEPAIRVAGCRAAGELPGVQFRTALCKALFDKEWEVISAAVKSLAKRNEIESVPDLVAAMQKAKGRLLDDFQAALETITGYKFGCDPLNWKEWLDESGGKIERNPKPRPRETPYVTYYKIPTRSLNMIFAIDISGSMVEKVTNPGAYSGEGATPKGDTKLDYVKAELIRVIRSLPAEAKFDIITFNAEANFWRGAQTLADDKAKTAASRFVDGLAADGGTNIHDALSKAFGALVQKTGYFPQDRTPDTLFLLSDGMPTVGPEVDPEKLMEIVGRINAIRRMVIHTIGVGKDGEPFLKPLAEKNGGQYRLVAW
ncbi:MAG: HEAT repeat domain-containing protein [Candidatus Brocadiia bacterium]